MKWPNHCRRALLLIFFLLFAGHHSHAESGARIISGQHYLLYVPGGIEADGRYPLVLALHPAADARTMIGTWKAAADKYRWLILASKESRNGIDMFLESENLRELVINITESYPVDREKIIATGFSGGGQASHFLAMQYPGLFRAIIVNTCKIHDAYRDCAIPNYPKGKLAVFLASRTDFRYDEMKADCRYLISLGWSTKWIEFEGGHSIAPQSSSLEAAEWLNSQL
jgi:predicted esterase